METIGNLLLKYHIPGVQDAEKRRICVEDIQQITGYPLVSKQIKYKNEKLFLTVPSVLKSAVLLKQHELTASLAARGVVLQKII
jgi:hypothetical protein